MPLPSSTPPLPVPLAVTLLAAVLGLGGCRSLPPGKPLSQLTAEEAAGHEVFARQCARCHAAYTTRAVSGPSLYGVFRQTYLPSGAPANDARVTAAVLHGRDMMPAFGQVLDPQELRDLLAYLHTL